MADSSLSLSFHNNKTFSNVWASSASSFYENLDKSTYSHGII